MNHTVKQSKNPGSKPYRFAVVMAEFNIDINQKLLAGFQQFCQDNNVLFDAQTDLFLVPGAYEIPLAAKLLAQKIQARHSPYQAIITIGTLIAGETDHYKAICDGVSQAIWQISVQTEVPVIFGVLMVKTRAQAETRSQIQNEADFAFKHNLGYEWGASARKMVQVVEQIQGEKTNG